MRYSSEFKSLSAAVKSIVLMLVLFGISDAQLQSNDSEEIGFGYYYITSSLHEPCPRGELCLNLTEFASNSDRYLSNSTSTTLVMAQETHSLDSQLLVANVSQFSLRTWQDRAGNNSVVTIVCNGGSFTFENVSTVYIRGLLFVGCTENYVAFVGILIFVNCTFDGQNQNGTALHIFATTANISSCCFKNNQGSHYGPLYSYYFYRIPQEVIVGGAIISVSSCLSMEYSTFEGNSAQFGGALFVSDNSELILSDCKFSRNKVTHVIVNWLRQSWPGSGNAVFASSGSSAIIKTTMFETNVGSLGELYQYSGLFECHESSILIEGCRINNISVGQVVVGDDSNITLKDTAFEHSNMYGCIDASGWTYSSVFIKILNCTFTDNFIHSDMVHAYQLKVQIVNSHFKVHNISGRVVVGYDSNITLKDTAFEHSNMYRCIFASGSTYSSGFIKILNCTFSDNFIHSDMVHAYQLKVQIVNSHFKVHNISGRVVVGYDSNITLKDTAFEHSNMYRCIFASGSTYSSGFIKILNCTFSDNFIHSDMVRAYQLNVQIVNSHFKVHNVSGSVVVGYDSNITLEDTAFEHSNMYRCIFASGSTYSSGFIKILNCTFSDNFIHSDMVRAYQLNVQIVNSHFKVHNVSGSVVVGYDSNITLEDTAFEHSNMHRCIYAENRTYSSGFIKILNCTFSDNFIHSYMVYAYQLNVQIVNSHFKVHNVSGSVVVGYDSNITLKDTAFEHSNMYGCIEASGWTYSSGLMEILNCTFNDNSIRSDMVHAYQLQLLIRNSNFINNKILMGKPLDSLFCNTKLTYCSIARNARALSPHNIKDSEGLILFVRYSVIHIDGCNFTGNRAKYGVVLFAFHSSITIFDTLITNNIADIAGVILLYGGNLNSTGISFFNNTANTAVVALISCLASFLGNTTLVGNLGSFYAVTSVVMLKDNIIISNGTHFTDHDKVVPIQEGGAVSIFQSSVQFSGSISLVNNFAENGGAMFIVESRVSMNGDIVIASNQAKLFGGGIYLYQSHLYFRGTSSVSENFARDGGGIYGVSSTITVADYNISGVSSLHFASNVAAVNGGALYLSTGTKIYVLLIASLVHNISFIENAAVYGGAVYNADDTNPELCNSSNSNSKSTECFFQLLALYPNLLHDVIQMQNETLKFTRNNATSSGHAIFGGLLDRCTLNILNPSRKHEHALGFPVLKSISNIDNTNLISSLPVWLCFCNFDQPDCNFNPSPIYVQKGKTFELLLVAVDQVNHTLESNVSSFLSNNGRFNEGQQQQRLGANCTSLTYNVFTFHDREELQLNAVGPCGDSDRSQRRVELVFVNCTCPIGFQVVADTQTSCECECHRNITKYVLKETCNMSTESFQRKNNAWISYANITGLEEDYYLLIHPHCPYDYCTSEREQVISLSHLKGRDKQCNFKRTGILCGICKQGFSVSFGSSNCMKCHKPWPAVLTGLIVLGIIVGIALVCLLLMLNLTVAIGTINGILFYANIINGNASIFFKDLPIPSFPSVFIAWLNLDIGFDICLYKGNNTYAKTWFQLAFPLYIIALVITVIIISKYSQRFSNLIGKKDPIATLATLILISYAKILSTVITMLSPAKLEYPDGIRVLWRPDATIRYLEPKHALLFLAAVIILLLGAIYTIILLTWQLLLCLPNWKIHRWIRNPKLSSFVQTYHEPYNIKCRYWTGLLLFTRIILYLVSAVNTSGNPRVPLIVMSLSVASLLVLFTRNNIYKRNYKNILELTLLFNVLFLTIFTWYATDVDDITLLKSAVYTSVMVTFILLLVVILHHVCTYTQVSSIIKKTKFKSRVYAFKNCKLRSQKNTIHEETDNDNIRVHDADMFELMDQCTLTIKQSQVIQPQSKAVPSVSTVEIPRPAEGRSPNPQSDNQPSTVSDKETSFELKA